MPTTLITGGHGGIGLRCAQQLASQARHHLVLAGRSPQRMEAVAQQLRANHGVKVATLPLDTSSLASVREAATQFQAMLDRGEIDSFQALLCNAGGKHDGPISYSPEGYETTFATNCLGHFLLVELLVERLAEHGRVVFTASGTHDPDTMDGKMVGRVVEPDAAALASDGKDGRKPLSGGVRYSTSKLCTMLYAYELHRRLRRAGSSIASIAFEPGSIPQTGLLRTMPKPVQWLAKTSVMRGLMKRMGINVGSLDFAGVSLAHLAVDPLYADGSGKYFQCKAGRLIDARSSKLSYDEGRARKLWDDSKQLVHLQPAEEAVALR